MPLVRLCFLKFSSYFSIHSLIHSFIHSLFFFIFSFIICFNQFLLEAFKVILLLTPLCFKCPFFFRFPRHFSVDISFLHHACNMPSSSHRLCVLSAESKHNCTTHVWTLGCGWTTQICQVALHEIHFCIQIFVATSVSFNWIIATHHALYSDDQEEGLGFGSCIVQLRAGRIE